MRRFVLIFLALLFVAPVLALGQSEGERRLDVIDISGLLDDQAVAFVSDTISEVAERGAEAVVIQLDSRGVVADRAVWESLVALVADPPVPVVVWVGPDPAVAFGGALDLAVAAQVTLAAPGAEIGYALPTFVAGTTSAAAGLPEPLVDSTLVVTAPVPGVVDHVTPAIQELIFTLDGLAVEVGPETRRLSTQASAGEPDLTGVYHKPGYWARFLRLAVTPEAAFMFLAAGLAIAAFEFYAIGPGLAAAAAAVSLFLAAYGVATLPVRWWALTLVVAGWWAMTNSYQRGSVFVLTGVGTVLMLVGGLWFVDGAPQVQMNPAVTLLIVSVVLFFYAAAMPTVARSRFSTRTIGREHMIGGRGVALVDFDPDGEVEIDGARWRAAAHREAGISSGDVVRIVEVDGLVLEVEVNGRENHP